MRKVTLEGVELGKHALLHEMSFSKRLVEKNKVLCTSHVWFMYDDMARTVS